MKKFLFIAFLFVSAGCFAQSDNLTFTHWQTSRYHKSDSVHVQFQFSTNTNLSPAKFTSIKQVSGPTIVPLPDSLLKGQYTTGTTVNLAFWVQGLAPGNYAFVATGLSGSGATSTVTDSLTVVADPVCPVCPTCPPIPAPRIAVSVSFSLAGIPITIPLPAAGFTIKYDNGSTQ